MKRFFGWLLLAALVSCSDAPEKPSAPRPKLNGKDSSVVKKEPANPYAGVDVSPMDMSYLPVDYPKMSVRRPQPVARVIYSRPHKQGRKIFGALLKHGEPWRLGANEATEIEVFQPITIQGRVVPQGKYILYCVPYPDRWSIVFNSNLHTWGLNLDQTKDKYRFDVPAVTKNQSIEYFTMVFQQTSTGADLVMAWDDVEVRLPIQYTQK
jgi:hypothetical protein